MLHHGPLLDVFALDMRTHKDANSTNRETRADGGVLGGRQTAWLQHELRRSRAVWKVIAADLPIGLVVPDDTDFEGIANADPGKPLGRELDLAPLLVFLRRECIRNHVRLTADVHYTAAHHYSPERAAFTDFDPLLIVRGRAAQCRGFGPSALDGTSARRRRSSRRRRGRTPRRPRGTRGHQFVGEVAIDGVSAEMTVRLRGIDGSVRFSTTLEPASR